MILNKKKYWPVWIMVIAMFCAWGAWGLVFNKMSPFSSPALSIPLFYMTSFLAFSLTFFTFSVLFRIGFFLKKTVLHHTYAALRQGVIFGCVMMGIMLFQQFHILSSWVALMIVSMGILTETFFWEKKE